MFNKKYLLLVLISLLCLLAISSVSASEDVVGDGLTGDVADEASIDSIDAEIDSDGELSEGEPKEASVELAQEGSYYQNTTLNVVVKDNQTDEGIEGAEIYLEFSNGKNATITTQSGGIGSYILNFTAGTYSVTASSLSTGIATFSPVTLNDITILPHDGKITITQSGKYSDDKVLTIKVYDQFTNKGFAQKVYLDFSNGKRTFVKTNAEGVATYKMNFKPGTYWVKASATNSNVNLDTATLSNVVISRTSVYIEPRPYAAYYASGKIFMIKVKTYNYKPASGVKLKIDIYNGKTKITVYRRTNATGWAQYPASKLSIGKHKVVVSIASNDLHAGKLKIRSITINKAYVDIYAPGNIQVAQKYDGKYGVKITHRATGDPIANLNVQLKVYTGNSYKTYNLKTNKNGYVCIQTKGLGIGKHNVVVSAGNDYYNSAQKTGNFVVSDRIPTSFGMVLESEDYWPDSDRGTLEYWITIQDSKDVIWGKELTFTDKNGSKTHIINGDGVTSFHFDSKFTACSVSFAGDSKYLPCRHNFASHISALIESMKRTWAGYDNS
ncbi:carboxypeptidase-like regulatory domain-containing protein [uncultured Methanobrevibacter sp.]|uniref:carboxypeptidase-like regulatory domain-containing protein n=1 Tax=uncultured Methanobrevibacter sp. TaxID=253161 RepID=UPI00261C6B42|nr:carboxypeptidase-like regulatory domain-containing protein [uncultured Methanobrevibacter sp.]